MTIAEVIALAKMVGKGGASSIPDIPGTVPEARKQIMALNSRQSASGTVVGGNSTSGDFLLHVVNEDLSDNQVAVIRPVEDIEAGKKLLVKVFIINESYDKTVRLGKIVVPTSIDYNDNYIVGEHDLKPGETEFFMGTCAGDPEPYPPYGPGTLSKNKDIISFYQIEETINETINNGYISILVEAEVI